MKERKSIITKSQRKKTMNQPSVKRRKKRRKTGKPKKKKKQKQKRFFHFISDIIKTFIVFALLFWGLSFFLFSVPKVSGYGMTPTLDNNDRVFVNKKGTITRFSLVYMNVPNQENSRTIRRVIGLPGEDVYYKNDQLWINGKEISERFLAEKKQEAAQNNELFTEDFSTKQLSTDGTSRIPEGKFLVLGDNRFYASDSRFYGYVDEKDIIGTVSMRLFPIHKLTSF